MAIVRTLFALLLASVGLRAAVAQTAPWSVIAEWPLLVEYRADEESAKSQAAAPLADFDDCEACCDASDDCDCVSPRTWYFRADYFQWNQRIAGVDVADENGMMPTLGVVRRMDQRRLRLEVFGNAIDYRGTSPFVASGPVHNFSTYIGGRLEYDRFLFPQLFRRFELLTGLGVRLWDHKVPTSDAPKQGYHELWMNLYPYVGLETRHDPDKTLEFFARGRVGVTAFTYEWIQVTPRLNAYPQAGMTGLMEFGLRGQRLSLSGYLETFAWQASSDVAGFAQPDSWLLLAGLQIGCGF